MQPNLPSANVLKLSTVEESILYYMDHPVAWGEDVIGMKYDPWQKEVLEALAKRRFVAVRSGHGVGKSFTMANAILWFLLTHPFCKVICTAPSKEQLFDVLWAELYRLIRESNKLSKLVEWKKDRIDVRQHKEEWFAIARTAEVRKLGKTGLAVAEGLQGRHAECILYVLDEASGIDEAIMNTIDGSLTSEESYVLMAGNPTRSSGTFYDAFHTKRRMWTTFKVSSEDSPRAAKGDFVRRMQEKYGSRDHPMYLIRVRGEFPPAQHNSVFSLDSIEAAIKLKFDTRNWEPYEIGLDVARYGGDKTVFAIKRGPIIERIETFDQISTMETAGRAVQFINQYKPIAVRIDTVGVGGGVYDRLKELGYNEAISVNGGDSPSDTSQFLNLRAESHWNLRTLLETAALKLPDDPDGILIGQMVSLTYKVTSKGKIQIESKEELRARGVESPDRLDAIILACMTNLRKRSKLRFGDIFSMER